MKKAILINNDKKIPYQNDAIFYPLWKYANAFRLTGNKLISFIDLMPLAGDWNFSTYFFLNDLRDSGLELEKITFNKYKTYEKLYPEECVLVKKYINKNPKTNLSKALTKLFRNEATFKDIIKIFGKLDNFFKITQQLDGLLDLIEFTSTPSQKNINPLLNKLNLYIKAFIENKLFSDDENFYLFSKQKEILLHQIENEISDYGLEFTFKQGRIISINKGETVSIGEDGSYLFIHTLVALEKQGLLKIIKISIISDDESLQKRSDDYKIKIIISQNLISRLKSEEKNNLIKLPKKEKPIKKKVFISRINGIYCNETSKKPNYPIKGKKRLKIIYNLKDGRKDANILCNIICYTTKQSLSKEIKQINNNFQNKLKLKNNLIVHIQTGGYNLNKEKYDIKIKD